MSWGPSRLGWAGAWATVDELTAQATSGTETRAQQLDRMLMMNAPVRFASPNAWAGRRPVFFTDPQYANPRIDAKAWMFDPEGIAGTEAGFASYNLTAEPTGEPPMPLSWTLPAYTGPSVFMQTPEQARALEAKFGTAGVNAGTETYQQYVVRTNNGANPTALPPQAASGGSAILDPTGTYLIDGRLVDGTGKLLDTPATTAPKIPGWFIAAGILTGIFFLSRRT